MTIREDMKKLLESGDLRADEYYWKHLSGPPLASLLPLWEINQLNLIATSLKLSGNINKKYDMIDEIMERYGFVRLGRGTNRAVYRYLENDTFCVKVAVDAVGIQDSPREFINQEYLYPFVAKVFEVDPTGTVSVVERVDQITNRDEFESIASKIYDLIRFWFTGKYVMEDIGTKYFMNWGTRRIDGCPVLLDYPYMYEVDYRKLKCRNQLPDGSICNGYIDYDAGYNYLYCEKCGARYKAIELAKAIENHSLEIIGGKETNMNISYKVSVKYNGVEKVVEPEKETKSIETKYAERSTMSKKAAREIKANFGNRILQGKYEPSAMEKKIAESVKRSQEARKSIKETVGEAIEKSNVEVNPVPDKPVATVEEQVQVAVEKKVEPQEEPKEEQGTLNEEEPEPQEEESQEEAKEEQVIEVPTGATPPNFRSPLIPEPEPEPEPEVAEEPEEEPESTEEKSEEPAEEQQEEDLADKIKQEDAAEDLNVESVWDGAGNPEDARNPDDPDDHDADALLDDHAGEEEYEEPEEEEVKMIPHDPEMDENTKFTAVEVLHIPGIIVGGAANEYDNLPEGLYAYDTYLPEGDEEEPAEEGQETEQKFNCVLILPADIDLNGITEFDDLGMEISWNQFVDMCNEYLK